MASPIPQSVQRAIDHLARLPGVGPKSASRLAFYLLNRPAQETQNLSTALGSIREGLVTCQTCFTIAESDPCPICADETRDRSILAVVEEPLDLMPVERSGYKGRYHVLGGAISPIQGIGPSELYLDQLLERLKTDKQIKEVILATNPTLEGEATALYIYREVGKMGVGERLKITRIARGLPIGGDLEYADELTVSRALEGRKEY